MHGHLRHTLYGLFTANAKGTDGCVVVLKEDGTLVDEDVVKELEKNTVVMIVNNQDAWKPVASACVY
jgi:CTP:molybdopterin cytidylyltransferase MocA